MAMLYFGLYLLFSSLAFARVSTTSNEECFDGSTSLVLTFDLYQNSCPEAEPIVFSWVAKSVSDDPRMAASLLRLHFHDCFGCDASVLLDDTPTFTGEKTAAPNLNSLRGFEVIDAIKNDLEYFCPETVSCADILAIAARDSVVLSGGKGWEVQMGRKDSLSANKTAANNNIPAPNSDVPTLVSKFQNVGLSLEDMVTLSGAHTLGKARCATFSSRLNGNSNANEAPDINLEFIQSLQQLCSGDANATLANLDVKTPSAFDNQYYMNLLSGEGLLTSDQVLVSGDGRTRELVETYVDDQAVFLEDFKNAMLRMGSILPAAGESGEIRRNCRAANQIN
ncbi:OLC1v1020531C1 [Oldenlandia corymbosa var. corymbosa]|uniref:Peroxidase n=1 Tax=Oldenlandia corymbosa var. corymbosa TaxID=529605 RepID=A0AAV1EGY1_OLDCO|nr:OLC1v1020531C1 [Oldenlandia corymbosa var. corymbosa]